MQTQTTVTKQTAKTLAKIASKTRAAETIRYALEAGVARPQAGGKLFAHTAAFFLMSGLMEGGAVPRKVASEIIGDTAIGYHLKRGNLELSAAGLTFTDKGETFFAERDADMGAVEDYAHFFATGEVGANMQKVGHQSFIRQIA